MIFGKKNKHVSHLDEDLSNEDFDSKEERKIVYGLDPA
jgi:hypothetical protein